MILIKDNHIDYAGGVVNAIQSAKAYVQEKNMKLAI
jgi:nicotinate-nucleotide pyrophosphorylase (carboxylating)